MGVAWLFTGWEDDLASVPGDNAIKLWDVANQNYVLWDGGTFIYSVAISPGGNIKLQVMDL
jgi:hypothetical protein